MDTKLEVVVIPVADVDRTKAFYTALGWREDADFDAGDGFRVVQVTPPGSPCSVIFGSRVTSAAPGSAQGLYLVVTDIEEARAGLIAGGAEVSEVFHDATGAFHRAGTEGRLPGPAPDRSSYGSFASFSDPDGNGWLLQEVTTRLPGRVTAASVGYDSAADLAAAMRRAEAAHGKYEKELGKPDPDWPGWYARYMVDEASTPTP